MDVQTIYLVVQSVKRVERSYEQPHVFFRVSAVKKKISGSIMHASFVETFVTEGRDYVFQKGIQAPSASISSIRAADVGVQDELCVGSVCVDTVAFGLMLRTSVQVNSLAMQVLATEVFMVNSMIGNTVLLPNQSVVSLTYEGGDYNRMNTDPTGASTASFATMVASAVGQSITESSRSFTSASSATASFINSLAKNPVPSSILGTHGITGMTGTDVTNQVAAHTAVFSTWSAIVPSTTDNSTTHAPEKEPSSTISVYAVSVTEGSIVVNVLITYPSWFTV